MVHLVFHIWLLASLISPSITYMTTYDIYSNLQFDACRYLDVRNDGQRQGNVANFKDNWERTLNATKAALKEYNKTWGYSISEQSCPKNRYMVPFPSYPEYLDIKCLVIDLEEIGELIDEDLDRFKAVEASYAHASCHTYAIYLHAWHQHPFIKRLRCYQDQYKSPDTASYFLFQYIYDRAVEWKCSLYDWSTSPFYYVETRRKCGVAYSKDFAANLREEIDKVCLNSNTELVCQTSMCTDIADTVDRFDEYSKPSAAVAVTDNYLNAMLLTTSAAIRKLNKLHPEWEGHITRNPNDGFEETYFDESWTGGKVTVLTNYLFDSVDQAYTNKLGTGLQLYRTMDLLPSEFSCNISPTVGSLCWRFALFRGMVQTLKQGAYDDRTHRKVQVNTRIDYRKFLEQTQQEKLLKLSQSSHENLLEIAKEIRDDIVHSLNQSFSQAINDNANEIKEGEKLGFDSLKQHFQREASFDKEIAKADVEFIEGEIQKYYKLSNTLRKELATLVNRILKAGFDAAMTDYAEKASKLVITLASMWNPLKWITGGTSLIEVMDASAEFMQSVATVMKTETLQNAWRNLFSTMRMFTIKLGQNQQFLDVVRQLVTHLANDSPPPDFGEWKDLFIKGYKAYTPTVNMKDLVEVATYWELLIDEGCNLIDSTNVESMRLQPSSSGGIKITLRSTCYDAKREVQKLLALNEEICEFQFDLMDSIAECVRASNIFTSAVAITTGLDSVKEIVRLTPKRNVLDEIRLLATYSTLLYRTTVLTAKDNYCNVLEYREGERPALCKIHDWDLADLLSRKQKRCDSTQDFKSVPTRPAYPGDTAYIDLKDLLAGKIVRFQIPNHRWLIEKGWIPSDKSDKPIFVQRFEIYLPVVSRSEKNVLVSASITVGNQLSRGESGNGTEYILNPRDTLTFNYKEGHSSCRSDIIHNPYNSNCRDLPPLCQVSVDLTDSELKDAVYPSILAMWNLQVTGYQSVEIPLPATDIDVKVGLKTCSPGTSSRRKRSQKIKKNLLQRNRRQTDNTERCCNENSYVNKTGQCAECPENSSDKYNGLLCECMDCLNGGVSTFSNNVCSCLCDHDHSGPQCETRICNSQEYKCNNSYCIPRSKYCDSVNDCDDGSDEPAECVHNYSEYCGYGFWCTNDPTPCVPKHKVCDGVYDCGSSHDEASCGDQQSKECPEGFMFYAGTCFLFKRTSANGSSARDYCESAGGQLAVFTKDVEHWFAYTMVLKLLTGSSLAPDYYPRSTSEVFWTNLEYNMPVTWAFWWIGDYDETLSSLKYPSDQVDLNDPFGKDTDKCLSVRHEVDLNDPFGKDTDHRLSVRHERWDYQLRSCSDQAEGIICTHRPGVDVPTMMTTKVSITKQATKQKDVASSISDLRELNKGISKILDTIVAGFQTMDERYRMLIQMIGGGNVSESQSHSTTALPYSSQPITASSQSVISSSQTTMASPQAATILFKPIEELPEMETSTSQSIASSPKAIVSPPMPNTTSQRADIQSSQAIIASTKSAVSSQPITASQRATVSSSQPITASPKSGVSSSQPITASPQSVVSSQPITASPKSGVSSSQPITASPQSVVSSQPITASPQSVVSSQPITASPQSVASSSQPITASPQSGVSSSQPITASPQSGVSSQPITASPKSVVSSQPITVSLQSVDSSSQPITASPQSGASSSQSITYSPQSGVSSSQPITVYQQTLVSLSQPITASTQAVVQSSQPITASPQTQYSPSEPITHSTEAASSSPYAATDETHKETSAYTLTMTSAQKTSSPQSATASTRQITMPIQPVTSQPPTSVVQSHPTTSIPSTSFTLPPIWTIRQPYRYPFNPMHRPWPRTRS